MQQSRHANEMAQRFREMVESTGDSLNEKHYDELRLIIESGLDAALVEAMEKIAGRLEEVAHEIKHSAETVN